MLGHGIGGRHVRHVFAGAVIASAIGLTCGVAASAQAATYTVGTTADSTGTCASPSSGQCSLRQLIAYENGRTTAPSPSDTIVVPAGTYDLTSGPLTITQSLNIVGAGARSTHVAQTSTTPDRVFDIQGSGGSPTVGIAGLTISGGTANSSNGYFGGDVRNQGVLTLTEDWITGGATSFGSGAGVSNDAGTLTLDHSLVSGNSGGNDSGGIQNFGASGTPDKPGHLLVENSTIADNSASLGGGIFSWRDANNTTVVANSTIAYNDGGTRTDEPNSGGLLSNTGGPIKVTNTIVAYNTVDAPFAGTASNCAGALPASGGYNLETSTDCGFTSTGDLQSTDPQFASSTPVNNGGNTNTLTIAVVSPAVDHIQFGTNGCSGTDQRDLSRPQGTGCDIGAVELVEPTEGSQFSGLIANARCAVSGTPTIHWGDGSSSSATIPPAGQSGGMNGTHTYAEEDTYSGSISYADDCGSYNVPFTLVVRDATLTSSAQPIAAVVGTPFSGRVATFSDADPGGTVADYSAMIDWGDGTSSPGTVTSNGNQGFAVTGTHTYASAGSDAVTVSIADLGGSATTAHGDAQIAAPVQTATADAPAVQPGVPTVQGSTNVGFSGSVTPEGLPTTAYFQYGLDSQYQTAADGPTYTATTPSQQVGSDFTSHPVSASVSGLLPNALYHVRLVATNSAGTTYGPDQIFTTAKDTPPPPPVLGQTVNVKPVAGLVLIKPPPGKHLGKSADLATTALAKGQGFIPLTEARQIPSGSQIDARQGTLQIVSATGAGRGKTQSGTFGGALFKLTQSRSKLSKGLTTLTLQENAFRGAPSYASCPRAATDTGAHAARLSSRVLQTLHASERGGHYRTRGRYSASTVRGTVWDTIDRCDGTLTIVHRGVVQVTDLVRHVTVTVTAGHSYLAKAPARRRG
jgi:hypothetical protein